MAGTPYTKPCMTFSYLFFAKVRNSHLVHFVSISLVDMLSLCIYSNVLWLILFLPHFWITNRNFCIICLLVLKISWISTVFSVSLSLRGSLCAWTPVWGVVLIANKFYRGGTCDCVWMMCEVGFRSKKQKRPRLFNNFDKMVSHVSLTLVPWHGVLQRVSLQECSRVLQDGF